MMEASYDYLLNAEGDINSREETFDEQVSELRLIK
jgi:hypothetical protein